MKFQIQLDFGRPWIDCTQHRFEYFRDNGSYYARRMSGDNGESWQVFYNPKYMLV